MSISTYVRPSIRMSVFGNHWAILIQTRFLMTLAPSRFSFIPKCPFTLLNIKCRYFYCSTVRFLLWTSYFLNYQPNFYCRKCHHFSFFFFYRQFFRLKKLSFTEVLQTIKVKAFLLCLFAYMHYKNIIIGQSCSLAHLSSCSFQSPKRFDPNFKNFEGWFYWIWDSAILTLS